MGIMQSKGQDTEKMARCNETHKDTNVFVQTKIIIQYILSYLTVDLNQIHRLFWLQAIPCHFSLFICEG